MYHRGHTRGQQAQLLHMAGARGQVEKSSGTEEQGARRAQELHH